MVDRSSSQLFQTALATPLRVYRSQTFRERQLGPFFLLMGLAPRLAETGAGFHPSRHKAWSNRSARLRQPPLVRVDGALGQPLGCVRLSHVLSARRLDLDTTKRCLAG